MNWRCGALDVVVARRESLAMKLRTATVGDVTPHHASIPRAPVVVYPAVLQLAIALHRSLGGASIS